MKNASVNNIVNLGNGTDVAGIHFIDFEAFFTLKHDRTSNFESFLSVIHKECGVFRDAALMQTE